MGSISNRFNIAGRLAPVALAVVLSACTVSEDLRGNLPDPEKIAQIKPGTTTKTQVAKILGTPSSASAFNDTVWYYISRRVKQVAFLSPTVMDQQVYVVDFDDRGVVKEVPVRPWPTASTSRRRLARLRRRAASCRSWNS